ncbi:bacteriophage T4 gp5 trimerisation domain-containing protein [Cricetibacter osteomyelitidis]|uniref:bacteriophage T4 gp5 trimerisation domain-containing protein n=1 Tax=Cricetibacter osteomyelitidis TaxID=1521931 RepID=UPI003C73EF8B
MRKVFIHAERDQNNIVNHDESTQIGNSQSIEVYADSLVKVGSDYIIEFWGNHSRTYSVK